MHSAIPKNFKRVCASIKIQFRSLCNLRIFRTLANSELWHIQKPGIFRTLAYKEPWHIENPHLYSEPWHTQSLSIFRCLVYSEL